MPTSDLTNQHVFVGDVDGDGRSDLLHRARTAVCDPARRRIGFGRRTGALGPARHAVQVPRPSTIDAEGRVDVVAAVLDYRRSAWRAGWKLFRSNGAASPR